MGLVDWRIVVAVGAVALVVALVGLRGRKADALPRCKRRRCRYDLSAFIGDVKPGERYPVTCPECGRVAQGEREVKWGKRKARTRVVWLGAIVLALCAMVGGVEVYARATSANTLAWLPLWLIMDRAETDTARNGLVHRLELLRRVEEDEIKGEDANRLIARLLEWQQDERIEWEVLGDVFVNLATSGHASHRDVDTFWANMWIFHTHIRSIVGELDAVPIFITAEWRGPSNAAAAGALFHQYKHTLSMVTGRLLSEPNPPYLTGIRVRIGEATMTSAVLRADPLSIYDVQNESALSYAPISLKHSFVWHISGPHENKSVYKEENTMRGVHHGLPAGQSAKVIVEAEAVGGWPVPNARFAWPARPPSPPQWTLPFFATPKETEWASRWPVRGEQAIEIRAHADRLTVREDSAIEDWLQRSLQPIVVRRLSNSQTPGYAVYLELRGDATPPPHGLTGVAIRASLTVKGQESAVTQSILRPELLTRAGLNRETPRIWVGNIESDSAELVVELDEDGSAYTSDLIGVPRFRVFWEIGRTEGSRP